MLRVQVFFGIHFLGAQVGVQSTGGHHCKNFLGFLTLKLNNFDADHLMLIIPPPWN